MSRRVRLSVLAGWVLTGFALLVSASPNVHATKYGAGSYGRCQYETCAISLTTSANVNLNVVPAVGSTRCTVSSDTVTVTTSSSTGYTLTLADSDTSNTLTASSNTIPATSGTFASPQTLSANTWGYRVDGAGSFGAGPTSAVSSAAAPSQTFAAIVPSSGTASIIKNSSVAATNGASTTVWYGVCVSPSQPSGSYSNSVTYTSVTN